MTPPTMKASLPAKQAFLNNNFVTVLLKGKDYKNHHYIQITFETMKRPHVRPYIRYERDKIDTYARIEIVYNLYRACDFVTIVTH